jgi:lipid-binding SYLF domain-containing protein
MDHFYGDKFKLGADVDIAAGPVGTKCRRCNGTSTSSSIYSYSISKGLFAGLSLSGAMMTTDHDTNSSYWGTSINSRDILRKRLSAARSSPSCQP